MQRKIILTGDGSHSLEIPGLHLTYHSTYGAIQESQHVFIDAGLHACIGPERSEAVRIFEVGFGTGLNALLTLIASEKSKRKIYYEAVELFPLDIQEVMALNYCEQLQRDDLQRSFEQLHTCSWEREAMITSNFIFKRIRASILAFIPSAGFDLIFFDAFDPKAQPELWTEEIFSNLFSTLLPGGILVTYSSKGSVRRALQSAGFTVEKIPGPQGKKEIVRAIKI
jgi:tRNA U34 5-methylaminomethyl-2-thiouridine-forming methyltransferase MnmC